MTNKIRKVALLGATSFVGENLIPLLVQPSIRLVAYFRNRAKTTNNEIEWRKIPTATHGIVVPKIDRIENWISVVPIWVLHNYFELLQANNVKRVVALSSTSRFTKTTSSNLAEQAIAERLIDGETRLKVWAEKNGIEWVILRPTLIYGQGQDKNITEIARIANRLGFFPLLGKASGLRQPIHVKDVAGACLSALKSHDAANRAYNISGGETLPYHEMVRRVFVALGRQPRMIRIPLVAYELMVMCLRLIPRYRDWSISMAERMNIDLVFDHSDAIRDFGFISQPFRLYSEDLPVDKRR